MNEVKLAVVKIAKDVSNTVPFPFSTVFTGIFSSLEQIAENAKV